MWRNKIKEDSVAALKAHDSRLVDVLRYLISLLDKRELQLPPGGLTEPEEIAVLRKELKNKEEAKSLFEKASRTDLVEQQSYEIEILKKYLPLEMAEDEINKIVDEVIGEKGRVFGIVMGEVMKRVAGRASGETVSQMVKQKIG